MQNRSPKSSDSGAAPQPAGNDPLLQRVTTLKGVGPVISRHLEKLGINNLGDLLHHIPVRYEDLELRGAIRDVPEGDRRSLFGVVPEDPVWIPAGQGRWECVFLCEDDMGTEITLQWFMPKRFRPPLRKGFRGWVTSGVRFFRRPTMGHPTVFAAEERDPRPPGHGQLVSVYKATAGVSQDLLRRCIDQVLQMDLQLSVALPEILTSEREVHGLYMGLHCPKSSAEIETCRHQLARLEMYLHAEGQAKARKARQSRSVEPMEVGEDLEKRIMSRFPFTFTNAQLRVVDEIRQDLAAGFPMARLVQGDVGSGKTAVAIWALLATVAHGRQAALLAPTTTLADQHLQTLESLLQGSRLKIARVVSGTSAAEKAGLADGEVNIVVGTHALISSSVEFKDLGLVIVDEEQKFGVQQRQKLAAKGKDVHRLHLSATPIPRSLALALRGEFDLSRVDEKPPGRKPVSTRQVPFDKFSQAVDFLCKEIESGHRVLFVVPRIEDGDGDDPLGVEQLVSKLQETKLGPFGIVQLHGRLPAEDRSVNMEQFRQGVSPVLVATSIVEVGLDVPELSVLWIENADRFGLSQLHQLRGRVGRGDRASWCFFTVEDPKPATEERLLAFIEEDDGFRIAERDLELRGGGEVQGVRQSGQGKFLLARPLRDLEAFKALSEVAMTQLIQGSSADFGGLRERLGRYLGPGKDLGSSKEEGSGRLDGPLAEG